MPLLPGLATSIAVAGASMLLGSLPWSQHHGFSALTMAIVLGMIVGNLMPGSGHALAGPGIDLAKKRLLRLGVVLYGLRLTVQDIGQVGVTGVLVDAAMLGSTFLIACWLGRRWLGLDEKTSMLVGIGSAICGAAAVVAAEPVVRARAEQVTVAVATVVVFGTIAIFVYPPMHAAFASAGWALASPAHFGVFIGSTVHEVAQVVAIGGSIGDAAADTAVITKMVRVMMLAPFLLGLAAWRSRDQRGMRSGHAGHDRHPPLTRDMVPWFALGFVAVVLLNSLGVVPGAARPLLNTADTMLLATAMAALGISTRAGALRQAGVKPLVLGLALSGWLTIGGAAVNAALIRVMH
ncbi:YeiH family protein [Roseateles chitinivorans]|uniref:YeiH family protein n=1 Tax=Roseateles chitinivorans TaxID=2917965 RepID=UPI003D665E6F